MKNKAISDLLRIGSSLLPNSVSAQLDAQLLLSSCLGYDKTQLFTRQHMLIPTNLINRYFFLIGQRAKNLPLAYLLNYKEFYGIIFNITPKVLVPRPETETIIDIALGYLRGNKDYLNIIDLGTGSGCIAIALSSTLRSQHRKNFKIEAIDNSIPALKIARFNKERILGKGDKLVKIYRLDYLKQKLPGNYDLILSNPPYLNYKEYESIKGTPVAFEPKNALYGAQDGLKYYRRINMLLTSHLKPKGLAILEIGQQSKNSLREIFNKTFHIQFQKDLTGFDRFLIISRRL